MKVWIWLVVLAPSCILTLQRALEVGATAAPAVLIAARTPGTAISRHFLKRKIQSLEINHGQWRNSSPRLGRRRSRPGLAFGLIYLVVREQRLRH